MFRIECFCDDPKLGPLLQALKGLAYDVTQTPVGNAKKVDGKVTAANGGAVEILLNGLKQRRLRVFEAKDARAVFAAQGLEGKAYSNALTRAQANGAIKKKRAGKGTIGYRYQVLKPKGSAHK